MKVYPMYRRPRRLWQLGSRTIAGRCANSCRFMCRCLAGHHPSTVGVPHMRSNASSSDGAGTTISCGATTPVTQAQYREFVQATGHRAPEGWTNGNPSPHKEDHPVADVSLFDAKEY